MSDDLLNRDRQIRAAALQSSASVIGGMCANNEQVTSEYAHGLAHTFCHYIHSGVWVNPEEPCEWGADCRFGGVS